MAFSIFIMLHNHHLYPIQAVLILRVIVLIPRPRVSGTDRARLGGHLLKICSVHGPGWPPLLSCCVRGGRWTMGMGTDEAGAITCVL